MIGYLNTATIYAENCFNYGDVSATSEISTVRAGGIVGQTNNSHAYIYQCANYGTIKASSMEVTSRAGGIVGYIYRVKEMIIENCYNAGSIQSGGSMGGILGYNAESTVSVRSCINYGTFLPLEGRETKVAGGIIGRVEANARDITMVSNCVQCIEINLSRSYGIANYGQISNCYAINLVTGTVLPCTIEDLNSIEFYIVVLGFDANVWDFSNLDVENGKYPVFKK